MAGEFDMLIAQGASAPVDAWDFSWLAGRATEARPTWRYFDRVAERSVGASRLLEIQAGVGNMLADLPVLPRLSVGTEGWEPSVRRAAPRLRARGAHLVWTTEHAPALPFTDASFDLVISRHPVDTWWTEIARVLEPGGRYLSQQVGPYTLRDLTEFLTGPLPSRSTRELDVAVRAAERAGLVIEDLRVERPEVVFYDIGAVVYVLRVVVWIVPDFTIDRYRDRLHKLHEHILRHGAFETTSSRFLIEAMRPT